MNKEQAADLIQKTFRAAFDKTNFRNFAVNVLNRLDESKSQKWSKQYIKDAFKGHVQNYERLGTYTSPDYETLDVLIVYLTSDSKLERARTAIRNFVADHLQKRNEKDAALVAFVSPTEKQWRFSYVKMEYAPVETKTGRIGVEARLTPARRFSYLVGEGESCHTAQSRFLGLLQNTETDPNLPQIEEAFSVEAVTKEFFAKYVELFDDITKALNKLVDQDKVLRVDFKAKGVDSIEFAKKLMGQIVFLYFLQKKGWLGVQKGRDWSTGPHDFLQQLARGEYGEYENFFNDILEPLFYNTLAVDRGHEAWCDRFKCRIPFLNGGLFEPIRGYDWKKTDIVLPNRLFRNNDFVEGGIIGTGVLDVFDRYNFTVNEAEPLEKEVAIDPEMLGKVFENLIESNRRKGLGTFYTPREIVHYMCQETLINYLDHCVNVVSESVVGQDVKQATLFDDNQAEQMTFTASVRHESVSRADIDTLVRAGEQISHYEAVGANYAIKMPKAIEKNAKALDSALKAITVCDPAVGSGAFPVGMMMEIVRARTALTPYFNDIDERTAYFFKRHAIQNSIYGVDVDSGAVEIAKLRLWLSLVVDEQDVQQIKPLPNLYYKIVSGNSLLGVEKTVFNEAIFKQIERLKPIYFDETDIDRKAALKAQIDDLIQKATDHEEVFDFEVHFSEIFHLSHGFDVVIANPPYLGEKGHKEVFRQIAASELGKRFYVGKMDLFYFFFHLALDLAKEGGAIAFISTNYFITATAAKVLRQDLKKRATIRRMINFNEVRIFESAQGQHNMITIMEKGARPEELARNSIAKEKRFIVENDLNAVLSGTDVFAESRDVPNSDLYEGDDLYIRLTGGSSTSNDTASAVLNKMIDGSVNLGSICNINCGIQTGCDRVKIEGEYKGVFVLSETEIHRFPKSERDLLRPFFKNSDIDRYYCSPTTSLRVIYTDRSFDCPSSYPTIISHLSQYREKLDKIREVRNGIIEFYQLQWPRQEKIFRGAKIVAPQRGTRNKFALNEEDWYASVDVYFLTQKDRDFYLEYILGLLNAKLFFFWLYRRGKRKGEMLELYQKPLSEIPIKRISLDQQEPIVAVVDKILAAKNQDPAADTTTYEQEIDSILYRLYGLTAAEIETVEAAS